MSVYEPSDHSITTWRAREHFLQIIKLHAPEVLEGLHGDPFECFRIAQIMNRWNLDDYTDGRMWTVLEEDTIRDSSIFDLRESLLHWAETFNLKNQWCLERAFRTLEAWHKHPLFEKSRMWARNATAYFMPVGEEEGKLNFSYERWDVTFKNRDEFQREVERAFRQHLVSYCDRIERLTQERGFIEQKLKRDDTHFQWLVWYQIKGKSQKEVSRQFNASRSAVAEGIKDVASMCGLTLRGPKKIGRPRKSDS